MNQTVLITGTSSGLGRATAKHFQNRGWNVVATMRDPQAGVDLAALDRTLVTRLDVQDHASIHSSIQAGIAAFGRIDVVVNNAGYGAFGPLEATTMDKIRRQFEVNVFGVLATTHALLPHFRANRDGTVINISSMGGRFAFPLGTLYHASKFAVEGLSESLFYELATLGIRVKLIEPGGMKTDFGGRSLEFNNDPAVPEYQPLVQNVLNVLGPMMAAGSAPEGIAEVVYAAATDRTDQLRYQAGADAVQLINRRLAEGDITFIGAMKAQFGMTSV